MWIRKLSLPPTRKCCKIAKTLQTHLYPLVNFNLTSLQLKTIFNAVCVVPRNIKTAIALGATTSPTHHALNKSLHMQTPPNTKNNPLDAAIVVDITFSETSRNPQLSKRSKNFVKNLAQDQNQSLI